MFLDVNGTYTAKKVDVDTVDVQKKLVEGLHSIHAKTTVNQRGEISWRGSYYPYDLLKLVPWDLIQRIFWLMRGRILIQRNSQGGVDLHYHVSLLLYRILLIIVNIVTIYYYLSRNEMLSKILLFVVIEWLFLYGAAYVSAKLGMNWFISERMYELDKQKIENRN